MTVKYDDTGPVVGWSVKAGDPIVKTWSVTGAASLSGATVTAAVRPSEDHTATATATFTCTTPTSTSVKIVIPGGISTPGRYWWALRVAMPDGETVYRGQGPLIVEPKGV